jgi:hypothetical protein
VAALAIAAAGVLAVRIYVERSREMPTLESRLSNAGH